MSTDHNSPAEPHSADNDRDDFDAINADGLDDQPVDAGDTPLSRDEEMERLQRAADEADQRVLKAQAEAENFRKRMRRDVDEQLRYATLPLITDLLQVRDNLHRALEAAGNDAEGGGENVKGLREGVAMVAKLLDDTMTKHGVVAIPTEGESFDPNVHEAISQMPSPDHSAGAILHVATPGFKLHDRVVRASQVVVAADAG